MRPDRTNTPEPTRVPVTLLGLALCSLVGSACARDGAADAAGTSVILITLDTVRADALSPYGGSPLVTPYLGHLASQSLVFERAYSVSPLTLPAHASMLTGLYPPRHRVHDNGIAVLPESAATLAERASEAGLATGAFVASTVLDRAFGLDQGFDHWEQPELSADSPTDTYAEFPAREVLARARRWLSGLEDGQPFLAWIHLYDAHAPYLPPAAFLRQAGGHPYLGEVAALDTALGEFLAPLEEDGTLARTLVLLVADHGESLGEHGEPTHGALLYEAAVRVPLIVRLPAAARGGERIDVPASVVDVAPTLAACLGLPADGSSDGVDLLGAPSDQRGLYLESYSGYLNYGWSPLAGWLADDSKYLHSSRPELYRLDTDPAEVRDVYASDAPAAQAARAGIASVWEAERLQAPESESFEPQLLAALRRLGYAASGAPLSDLPAPTEVSDRPAPLDRSLELGILHRANALMEAGQMAAAADELERIVEANRGHTAALELLAFARMQTGQFAEARELLEERVALGPERADVWLNLGLSREQLDDLDGAIAALERALGVDPERAAVRTELARMLRAAGRMDAAAALDGSE